MIHDPEVYRFLNQLLTEEHGKTIREQDLLIIRTGKGDFPGGTGSYYTGNPGTDAELRKLYQRQSMLEACRREIADPEMEAIVRAMTIRENEARRKAAEKDEGWTVGTGAHGARSKTEGEQP